VNIHRYSCGFFTDDPWWFEDHLFEHPGHEERTWLPAVPLPLAYAG